MHGKAELHCVCFSINIYCIVAIKRYYENERRKKKEHEDGMESYVEEQSKRRKYRSRRHRVCEWE